MELTGSTALVTGGGRGIGKAIVAELLRRGAAVTVLEIEPEHSAQAAAELENFIELVVPVLQERGRFKTAYTPGTFRQKLFGTERISPDHLAGDLRR